ncbi:MAG: recombinase family protein, partial [Pseudomonadota bacterium]
MYCRVSNTKQRTEGNGLDSQEHRCRQYAKLHGYEVTGVFPDDVTGSGDFMKRPGMVQLLAFLDSDPSENYIVIFDDLKRLARDREMHFKLRAAFASRKAEVACLNFNFDDTPEGEFIETVLAAQGQLERQQNRRQTLQKMKARFEGGYYVFAPPVGYKYERFVRNQHFTMSIDPLIFVANRRRK